MVGKIGLVYPRGKDSWWLIKAQTHSATQTVTTRRRKNTHQCGCCSFECGPKVRLSPVTLFALCNVCSGNEGRRGSRLWCRLSTMRIVRPPPVCCAFCERTSEPKHPNGTIHPVSEVYARLASQNHPVPVAPTHTVRTWIRLIQRQQ